MLVLNDCCFAAPYLQLHGILLYTGKRIYCALLVHGANQCCCLGLQARTSNQPSRRSKRAGPAINTWFLRKLDCMIITSRRVWMNRVRLPILCVPENLFSRWLLLAAGHHFHHIGHQPSMVPIHEQGREAAVAQSKSVHRHHFQVFSAKHKTLCP